MNQPLQSAEFVSRPAIEAIHRYSHRPQTPPALIRPCYDYFASNIIPTKTAYPSQFCHAIQKLLLGLSKLLCGKCDLVAHNAMTPNENKMSDGGRDRASFGAKVRRSSQNVNAQRSSALLDIGSRWKEIEARTDQITGKPKGKRTVYVVENFKRCDGEPMVRYSRQKHGSQREWIMPIANFTARYAPMSNDPSSPTGACQAGSAKETPE